MTNEELKNYLEDENWELLAPDLAEVIENYIKTVEKETGKSLTEQQKKEVANTYYQEIAEVLESR